MRVCELCGREEDIESIESGGMETRLLHICETCRQDRNLESFDDEQS